MHIIMFSFGQEIRIECMEGYMPTIEQLEWLKELALKEYLAKPLSERIKCIENDQTDEAWHEKATAEFVNDLADDAALYVELYQYAQEYFDEAADDKEFESATSSEHSKESEESD